MSLEIPRGKIASPKDPGPLAISVKQPWAWAIVTLGKNIENRVWDTTYRGELLIHSSMQVNQAYFEEARRWILERGFCTPEEFPRKTALPRGEFVARCNLVAVEETSGVSMRPWEMHGGYTWFLGSVVPISGRVACRGAQKLWKPPAEVLERLSKR